MDLSYLFDSGPRISQDEEENWLTYLNLDDPEQHSPVGEGYSFPESTDKLQALESSRGNLIIQTLDLLGQTDETSLLPKQGALRTTAGLPKHDRAPSLHRSSLTSSNSEHQPRKKARKERFTASQNDLLETWLASHTEDPYPKRTEKEGLAVATGLTVVQIQSWFARTRQRKLRQHTDESLRPSEIVGDFHTRNITKTQQSSENARSTSRSGGGGSTKLSVGPGLSSLAVGPASPQLDTSDEQPDGDVWELQSHDSMSVHSYREPSALSSGASKVHWWLGTLPEKTTEHDSDQSLMRKYFSLSRDTSPSTGRLSFYSALPERKAALIEGKVALLQRELVLLERELALLERKDTSPSLIRTLSPDFKSSSKYHFLSMQPPKTRENVSVSSSVGSNVLSSRQSSRNSGNLSATSVRTFSSSRTSYSFSPRRGRRIPAKRRSQSSKEVKTSDLGSQIPSLKDADRPWKYCCTYCTERFRNRYTWRRHEESRHAPQISWICRPVKPSQLCLAPCPLCHFAERRPVQCPHNMLPCWVRPEMDRTFYRKDNLVQHLKGMHNAGAGINSALLDELTESVGEPNDLTCHFCEHRNGTWQDRASHIAGHFASGMTMSDWKPPEAGSGEFLQPYNPPWPRQ